MKLRLRNYETKETLRIEVTSPSSLFQLQGTLSLNLPAPHPSPSSLRFSLNAKDLLLAPSPDASLQSIGVLPGDLIYFSLNPTAFSPPASSSSSSSSSQDPLIEEPSQMPESSTHQETPPIEELPQSEDPISEDPKVSQEEEEIEGTESMDVDAISVNERLSEPYFLRKVLREGLGHDRSSRELMAMAVHAVLLESGFVGFDPVSKQQIDGFLLPDAWPSPVSVCYSLPELLRSDDEKFASNYVVLKFQTLGNFFQVYGCLVKGDSGLYQLSLDEHRFAPTLDLVWANCDWNDTTTDGNDGFYESHPEKEIFKFWKIVKDGLVSPLLIDLSYKTGLSLPACLMRLPIDLKLRILELLPGADIARMACVCSEMRYLASNNDLWKQKCEEEFPNWAGSAELGNWKSVFHSCWESRKKRKRMVSRIRPLRLPIRVDPIAFGGASLSFGGEFQHLPPGLVVAPPVNGPPGPGQYMFPRYRLGRRFHCHGVRQNNA